jgi:hypothetical protein
LATGLSTDISSEASSRVSADTSLSSDLSAEESARIAGDASLAADLSSEISGLADVDGATISLDAATNTIKLKQDIAAPASGMYTFNSDVEVSGALTVAGVNVMNAISSEVSSRISGDASLASALSSEISRAESAEDSLAVQLSTDVSYLIANTDLTSIDSFAEVSDAVSAEVSRATSAESSIATSVSNLSDNTSAYVVDNRPTMVGFDQSPNGTITNFTAGVVFKTEIVFLNGLMLRKGDDYTVSIYSGQQYNNGTSITFLNAPAATDKVDVYGVPTGTMWNGTAAAGGGGKGGGGK